MLIEAGAKEKGKEEMARKILGKDFICLLEALPFHTKRNTVLFVSGMYPIPCFLGVLSDCGNSRKSGG